MLLEAVGSNLQLHPLGMCAFWSRANPFRFCIAESSNFFFAISMSIAWLRFSVCFRGVHLRFLLSYFLFAIHWITCWRASRTKIRQAGSRTVLQTMYIQALLQAAASGCQWLGRFVPHHSCRACLVECLAGFARNHVVGACAVSHM
jgi:hypothetical protein